MEMPSSPLAGKAAPHCDRCGEQPVHSTRMGSDSAGRDWVFNLCSACEARLPPEEPVSDADRKTFMQSLHQAFPEGLTREQLWQILSDADESKS